jgi:chaperonin GroES
MHVRPLHDQVMVQREAVETMSPGGLHLPDLMNAKPLWAKVVEVGADVKFVAKGDRVYLDKYAGRNADNIDGENYLFVKEDEIAMVMGTACDE